MERAAELGHGDVVWAANQTAGRGRMDRTWLAAPGRSLTFSVVIRDPGFAGLGASLGQIAACAVADLLDAHGIMPALKWPNDVLVDGNKIAGILAEQDSAHGIFVLGVGLNVNLTPEELAAAKLQRPATSLQLVTGRDWDCATLFPLLLRCLEYRLNEARDGGLGPLWKAWVRLDWLKGRRVCLSAADRQVQGECLGIDTEGRLRVRTATGQEEAFWTGDVERVGLTD
jgi:BirA family biotin operon repressor/biotin-[acetyl-CoA-carboxylase] ligase